MSIFTKPNYSKKYLLTHPWCYIRHIKEDIECAWQRATKGYCYRDLWSIKLWFLELMPEMLTEFKDNLHSFPMEMKNKERWQNELEVLIKLIEDARDADYFYEEELIDKALSRFKEYFYELWD